MESKYNDPRGEEMFGAERPPLETSSMPVEKASHPRDEIPAWRWSGALVLIGATTIVIGFDVSNVATIQPVIYEAFSDITLLPWLGISYAMTQAACIPLLKKLDPFIEYHFLGIFGSAMFAIGSAVAGSAESMSSIIVGRVITGIGGGSMLHMTGAFLNTFATISERSTYQAGIGLFYILGMLLGPIISAAFANNPHTTWRWAFYLVVPLMGGLVFPFAILVLPRPPKLTKPSRFSLVAMLSQVDWVGALLLIVSIALWDYTTISSGTSWGWNSGAAVASWVITGLVIVVLILQQRFCWLTTPETRLLPIDLLTNRTVLLVCISTCVMTTNYSMSLYYTPLFFAFARGTDALGTAIHTLPFLGTFIGIVMIAGILLAVIRLYAAMYLAAGLLMVAASGYLITISPSSSDSNILGCTAILGAASAICWPIGVAINTFILPKERTADVAMINNFLITAPCAITLGMAGCIFENLGFNQIKSALSSTNYSDEDIRQALAGLSSPLFSQNSTDAEKVVEVLINVLQKLFYIQLAAGIILVVSALCMKWEALDFKKAKNSSGMGQSPTQLQEDM